VVASLSRAGALVIGLDIPLVRRAYRPRGGAESEALLNQAIAQAGNVVSPVSFDPPGRPGLVPHARRVGHTLVSPDPDGTVRRVPLFARHGEQAAPAFGLALAAAHASPDPTNLVIDQYGVVVLASAGSLRVPMDRDGRAPLRWVAPARLSTVPFADLWTVVEQGDRERLRALVEDKLVLVLVEPARQLHPTPVGPMSDVAIHLQLANAVLTGSWWREIPVEWTLPATLALAALAAWLWVALRWWQAAVGVAVLAASCGVAMPVSARVGGLLLPVLIPLAAVALASAGALGWNQLGATRRLRHLEGEVEGVRRQMTDAREALVRQESTVEALEEDLEAARAAVERSLGGERELARAAEALRTQLGQARAQEEETRGRLQALERELAGLRAVERPADTLDDAERERLRREAERLGIVTRDAGVLALFRDLEKGARSSLPILLTGEPGTGKELFARAAHRLGPRAGGPFVAVNMAAISPDLFESELFGHVRGSFTGAVGDRKGYFEQAERGTIFLDEVGELRPEHQVKLLRVLQEGSFHRVGATRPTTVDVRVVAASNRDLERGVAEGWFREDLYFRLKGLVLRLPPLRERRADVPLLATRFVQDAAVEAGRPGLALSQAALAALERHEWPGNVRELQHCLRRAVALAEGQVIAPEDLGLPGPRAEREDAGSDAVVLACLRRQGFDMQATARALGWDRSTVTQRLKGLGFRALVEAGGDRGRAARALAGDPVLARTVELKLREYHEHLLRALQGFESAEPAVEACRRRFKNLPERHFRALERLVRRHFEGGRPTPPA
jgi:DNA-binding NtrC family response regulator/CHASE2 domain-containing sensor protein